MLTRRQLVESITALGTSTLVPLPAIALQAGEPSRTAQSAALHRAAHQLLDTPRVFDDPLALKVIGHRRRTLLALYQPMPTIWRYSFQPLNALLAA